MGILALTGSLFSGPASATVTPGCYGTVNGRSFASITLAFPLRIREDTVLNVQAGSHLRARLYVVRMAYFGIRYSIRGGTTNDNMWEASATASDFLNRGTGNYIVEGILANNNRGAVCLGVLYFRVNGNPFSQPLGQAAGGVTALGAAGLLLTAITGSKEPQIPGFEDTTGPEEEKKIEEKQKEEKNRTPEEIQAEQQEAIDDELNKKCFFLVLPALILTTGMVAAGASVSGGVTSPRIPRVRWRPRLSFVGIGSGILFAVGSGVLLQQYGAIWPTLGMGVGFLVGGIALGILVPTLARLRVVRKINRRLEAYGPPRWTASHRAPDEGLSVWDQPDPSIDAREEIGGGVELQVTQVSGDWALVKAENQWSGWVDARLLVAAEAVAPETIEAESSDSSPAADWYPDPAGEARLRYWDGDAWTDDTSE
ncbi:MAG: DUF2510 domain-containing protein [Actinomycetota bacterium]